MLVVDDHPVNREVLVRQLELLGVDCRQRRSTASRRWRPWAAGRLRAVLADIHMPRMDGYELTRRIRAEEAQSPATRGRTPIVAVTANAMKGEERALPRGRHGRVSRQSRSASTRLRATLERWLPIQASRAQDAAADGAERPERDRPRACSRAWLGDDAAAIDSLLAKFRDTAVDGRARDRRRLARGDLAALAAAAHKLKGAAQAVGAERRRHRAQRRWKQAGKAGDCARCREGLGPLAAELRRALARDRRAPSP